MAGWTNLADLVRQEVVLLAQQGADVEAFRDKVEQAGDDEGALMSLYQEMTKRPIDAALAAREPDGLEAIRALQPGNAPQLTLPRDEAALLDKFHGAWLGRSAGCALGKPIETGPYFSGTEDAPGWLNVKRWFEGADAWPIGGYTPLHSRAEAEHGLFLGSASLRSTRENIAFMETDDDIRYTVLGLILMEEKGLNWGSFDVGKIWHDRLPYRMVCTAETQAYVNFAQVTHHHEYAPPADWEAKNKWVRTYLNPYREYIGAQIRVDAYAYAAAGNPALAAELAWRDAIFSHERNGIYGAMFCAAVIAAAFATNDPHAIIQAGLSQIPAQCRLTEAIEQAVAMAKSATDVTSLASQLWDAFHHYGPVHTINNAALCAASIVYAGDDFEKAITTSVMGWDTDCNGATVGSAIGAMIGARALPAKWTDPLHDTLYSGLADFHPISIEECARRSYQTYLNAAKR